MALYAFSRDLLLCAALIGCTISFFLLIVVCGASLDSVEGPSLDSVEGCLRLPSFAALSQFFYHELVKLVKLVKLLHSGCRSVLLAYVIIL
jgi:hypothetical protein